MLIKYDVQSYLCVFLIAEDCLLKQSSFSPKLDALVGFPNDYTAAMPSRLHWLVDPFFRKSVLHIVFTQQVIQFLLLCEPCMIHCCDGEWYWSRSSGLFDLFKLLVGISLGLP